MYLPDRLRSPLCPYIYEREQRTKFGGLFQDEFLLFLQTIWRKRRIDRKFGGMGRLRKTVRCEYQQYRGEIVEQGEFRECNDVEGSEKGSPKFFGLKTMTGAVISSGARTEPVWRSEADCRNLTQPERLEFPAFS
jgi:hypothetical protein